MNGRSTSSRTGGRVLLAVVLGVALLLTTAACSRRSSSKDDITKVLQADPDLSTYSGLIEKAGLGDTLNQKGPFTVFAPDNKAFEALDPAVLTQVSSDVTLLRSFLTYTIVPGDYPDDKLETGQLQTQQGAQITVTRNGTTVTVDDATVVPPEQKAKNGVVHVIDKVIVPPGSSITPSTPAPTQTIVGIVSSNPDYSTLSQLLVRAGLAGLLADTGPYTLFAASNAAFKALPPAQYDYLTTNTLLLKKVLAYSIVLGAYPTSRLTPGALTSLTGEPLSITVAASTYKVNTATVFQPDLLATNGVVQGVNQVLVPPGVDLNPPPPPTTTTQPPTTPAPTTTVPPTTVAPTTAAPPATTAAPPATTAAPPPTTPPPTAPPTTPPPPTTVPAPNLYDVLKGNPDYTLIVQLIDAANLKDRLATANQITIFAPTNGAFAADPTSAQDRVNNLKAKLTANELASLLSYQGVPQVLPLSSLKDGQTLQTFLAGEVLTVKGSGAQAQIKGAQNTNLASIVDPDVKASNGILQGVDRFLVPAGVTLPPA